MLRRHEQADAGRGRGGPHGLCVRKNGNRLSCAYPNGVENGYTYDALNRVETAVTAEGATTIYSTEYAYDLAGNRREIDEASLQADNEAVVTRKLDYEYDYQYRLTSESWQGESCVYTYGPAGNRLTMDHNALSGAFRAFRGHL